MGDWCLVGPPYKLDVFRWWSYLWCLECYEDVTVNVFETMESSVVVGCGEVLVC